MTLPRPLVELRRYTLVPDGRGTLMELFRRHFSAGQRAVGIELRGPYADLDDPCQMVWLRAFPGPQERQCALEAFYGGEVWREHREVANATMVDSDHVHLMEPFPAVSDQRDVLRAAALPAGEELRVAVLHLRPGRPEASGLLRVASDVIDDLGGRVHGWFRTTELANTFTALPVRGEDVLVGLHAAPAANDDAPTRLHRALRLHGLESELRHGAAVELVRLGAEGDPR